MPRYFENETTELRRRDPNKQLRASLERLVTFYPPQSIHPGGGLYYGPVGIAYLFLVLGPHYNDLSIQGCSLDEWMTQYYNHAKRYMKSYRPPDRRHCDGKCVETLCKFTSIELDDQAGNEWLYGRAGYLYFLRMVKSRFMDDVKATKLLDSTADAVIKAIMACPRPWTWHGSAYLGAAHGTIGIMTQIVLTNPAWAPKLAPELKEFLAYQYDSGNWPSSLPPGQDCLVQVCHGAPGVIISLKSIKQYFPDLQDKIEAAIAKGTRCIQERGLLTKEPGLCHGISGNALALDGVEFELFLSFTTGSEMRALEKRGLMEGADHPESLWCGEAGRAWTWAVADKGIEQQLLGYNDV